MLISSPFQESSSQASSLIDRSSATRSAAALLRTRLSSIWQNRQLGKQLFDANLLTDILDILAALSVGRRAWLKSLRLAFGIVNGTVRLHRFRSRLLVLFFRIEIAASAAKKK